MPKILEILMSAPFENHSFLIWKFDLVKGNFTCELIFLNNLIANTFSFIFLQSFGQKFNAF